ncbi:MAG: hypothetical protein ACTSUB_10995, partial [Candidatus Thorarchaeota archaeon]
IFRQQGWKVRPTRSEVNPEEIYRLYFGEEKTLLETARILGFKTKKPIERVMKEQGWEIRQGGRIRKKIDLDEVHRLYYDKQYTFHKLAEHFGFESLTIFTQIFKEQGWDVRPLKKELDPEEIRRLYFDEEKTLQETAEHLGLKSYTAITRVFEEQGWIPRRSKADINLEKLKKLYYDEKIDLKVIAKQMNVSRSLLYQRLKKMGLPIRKKLRLTEEELKDRRKERDKEIHKLRELIFGSECVICGKPKEHIHRKNGESHSSHILWSRKILQTLNPDEWAALCKPCHFSVHALMESRGFEWYDIYRILKNE